MPSRPISFRKRSLKDLFKLTITLVAIALLGGCATPNGWNQVGRDVTPTSAQNTGWLVASVGVLHVPGEGTPFVQNRIDFRAVQPSGRQSASSIYMTIGTLSESNPGTLDIIHNGLFATVQRIALVPGEYSLVGGQLQSDGGHVSQTVFTNDQDLRFHVVEGETTYLGSFVARTFLGKNMFGMTMRAGGYFEVHDQRERDLEILARRDGDQTPFGNVVDAALDPADATSSFFRFRLAGAR